MLRSEIIRLAHEKPELRPVLLPLLQKTAGRHLPLAPDDFTNLLRDANVIAPLIDPNRVKFFQQAAKDAHSHAIKYIRGERMAPQLGNVLQDLRTLSQILRVQTLLDPSFGRDRKIRALTDKIAILDGLVREEAEDMGVRLATEDKEAVSLVTKDTGEFLQGMKAFAEIHRRKGDLLTWDDATNAQVETLLATISKTRGRMDQMGNLPVAWRMGSANVQGVIMSDPRRGNLYLKLDNFPGALFDPDEAVKGVIQYAAMRGAEGPARRGPRAPGKVLRRRPGRGRVQVVAARWLAAQKKR